MGKKPASDSVTDLGAKEVAPTSHASVTDLGAKAVAPTSHAVVRWNGSIVARTQPVGGTINPALNEHILIRVPTYMDLVKCVLEVEMFEHRDISLGSHDGTFFGRVQLKGRRLLDLLVDKVDDYGDMEGSWFLLEKSDYYSPDSQGSVQGSLELRGQLEPPPREATEVEAAENVLYTPDMVSKWARMRVVIVEACALAQTDLVAGRTSAFVTVCWNGREVGRTTVCRDNLNPTWEDEGFDLYLPPSITLQGAPATPSPSSSSFINFTLWARLPPHHYQPIICIITLIP